MENATKRKRGKRIALILLIIIVVFIVAMLVYLERYYHADADAMKALDSDAQVTVTRDIGRISV